ncbi:hypothetical protein BT67DRAFT_233876 [Trichocladium antarcticum]|uniref:Uncharacterized protein n=1 Tax=Trichocladium antarcticum TaxID=1450529 RepID=A0AAN6UNY6_9PEZI|nr:hypothetical protein BT67DRAFT_233876 [Trichocladium antarcticum]
MLTHPPTHIYVLHDTEQRPMFASRAPAAGIGLSVSAGTGRVQICQWLPASITAAARAGPPAPDTSRNNKGSNVTARGSPLLRRLVSETLCCFFPVPPFRDGRPSFARPPTDGQGCCCCMLLIGLTAWPAASGGLGAAKPPPPDDAIRSICRVTPRPPSP